MKKPWLALVFGSALFLAACGGGDEEATTNNNGGTDNAATETASADGEKLVKQSCANCHGGNLQGMGNTPALSDVGSRLSEEQILDIIVNGTDKGMPKGLLTGADAEAAAAWLATQK